MTAAKKPAKRGRPSLINEKLIDELTGYLAEGLYIEHACSLVGIHDSTFHSWMRRARQEQADRNAGLDPTPDNDIFLHLLASVEKAHAIAAREHLGNIRAAANDGTWQASAWILERKFPKMWGRVDRTELSGPGEGPIRVNVSTEDLERKIQRILDTRD